MSELGPSPEREAPRYTREQVVQAFAGLVAKGYDHPDDLPLEGDAEVSAAQQMVDAWRGQEFEAAAKSPVPGADILATMSVDTIFVDAGFRDPTYLREVCGSFLDQDLADAEEAGLPEVAEEIRAKIAEIEALMKQS